MRLKELGEERIVKALEKKFSSLVHPRLIKGIGDDTSVTREKDGRVLLATTDILIEDTHFKLSYTPVYLLGKKSLSISLSDIAAMGGEPLFFLVSIGLPPDTRKSFVDELYNGVRDSAKKYGAVLAGGNTARLKGRVMISTTVLGEMPENEVVYRNGARINDTIYVTGTIGDAALGLKALKRYGMKAVSRGPFKKAALKHLDPTPRLRAGRMLAAKKLAHSMIDISDGLALDLKRICEESGVGAVVRLENIPLSGDMLRFARSSKKTWVQLALSGGEDYELLFTSSADPEKISGIGKTLNLAITPIGKIVRKFEKDNYLRIIDLKGNPVKLRRLGFKHF